MAEKGAEPEGGLEVEPVEGGCRLAVRVRPSARAAGIGPVHAGALKVSVTAPAERGRANRAVQDLLARALEIPRSRVAVVSGHGARTKRIRVEGLAPDEVMARLARRNAPRTPAGLAEEAEAMGNEPKTAYEIAMERLKAKDRAEGKSPQRELTGRQKEEIAEVRAFYHAKLAEREILFKAEKKKAAAAPDKLPEVEEAYRTDRRRLESERDSKIAKIRGG